MRFDSVIIMMLVSCRSATRSLACREHVTCCLCGCRDMLPDASYLDLAVGLLKSS